MSPKTLFNRSLQQANNCIRHVQRHQLTNDTPCTDWDLKALLNHMVYELSWVAPLLAGKTLAEVGKQFDGDLLGDSVAGAWTKAADTAHRAVADADPETVVHLSYGDRPAKYYIAEVGTDMFIHTWDVAEAILCTLELDDAVLKTVYGLYLPQKDKMHKTGLFAPPLKVDDFASPQTKLLALFGRKASAA